MEVLLVRYLLAAVALACTVWFAPPQQWTPNPEPPPQCEEDQPCWDCTTMGNRICGPNWTT